MSSLERSDGDGQWVHTYLFGVTTSFSAKANNCCTTATSEGALGNSDGAAWSIKACSCLWGTWMGGILRAPWRAISLTLKAYIYNNCNKVIVKGGEGDGR